MFKYKLISAFTITVLTTSGCATVKTPQVAGGNQRAGIVELTYDYHGIFEKPQVDWEQAKKTATSECQNWGYKPAQKLSEPREQCISRTDRGSCAQYKVITDYQCELTKEQIATNEAAEKKEHEQMVNEENRKQKAKQKFLSGLSSYQNVFHCSERYPGSGQAKYNAKELLRMYQKGDSNGFAAYLNAFKCDTTSTKQISKYLIAERGNLLFYDDTAAYYSIDMTLMKDGWEGTLGIVAK